MKLSVKSCLSLLLSLAILFQFLTGCSNRSSRQSLSGFLIQEDKISEQFIDENIVTQERLDEKYITEHLVYEQGLYEYRITEDIISQAYIIETIISETTKDDILAQLPSEILDYDIDWAKVIGKFTIGTAIIITVGIVNYFSAGSTYFVFGSPASVAKDALIGGAVGIALNEVINCVKAGTVAQQATKKYAIEGFAEGYMWGAISSVLKIAAENFKRLKVFKLATGGTVKIRTDGSVVNAAGKIVGKAYYDKDGLWHLVSEATQTVQVFDSAGKEIISLAGNSLPANSKLRLGTDNTASICYTDDIGNVMRIGDDLLPNTSYTINGYSYSTDQYGRINEVSFEDLQLKPEGRSRLTIQDGRHTIGKGFEKPTDDRGHIIADMFDGNNTLANIVPMDKTVNQVEVKAIEDSWAQCLEQGGSVSGSIKIAYSKSSFRPDAFEYNYDLGNGLVSTFIPNG